MRVQFLLVGRAQRAWRWAVRDDRSNTIAISAERFPSLRDALRDARARLGPRPREGGAGEPRPAG